MCVTPTNQCSLLTASSSSIGLHRSTQSAFSMPSRCNTSSKTAPIASPSSSKALHARNGSIARNQHHHNDASGSAPNTSVPRRATDSKRNGPKSNTDTLDLHVPKNPGLIGLKNLGNTCYMNAALQALSNCPELTDHLVRNARDMGKPGLAQSFAVLLHQMWVGDNDLVVSPHHHLHANGRYSTALKYIQYHYLTPDNIWHDVRAVYPMFRSYFQQQDAQEFLRCFLNQIHEELKVRITVDPSPTDLSQLGLPSDPVTSSPVSSPSTSSLSSLNVPTTDCCQLSGQKIDAHRSSSGLFQPRSESFAGLNIVDYNVRSPITLQSTSPTTFSISSDQSNGPSSLPFWPSSETLITSLSANGICTNDIGPTCSLNVSGDHFAATSQSKMSACVSYHDLPSLSLLTRTDSDTQSSIDRSSPTSETEASLFNGQPKVARPGHVCSPAKTTLIQAKPHPHTRYKSIVSDVFDGQLISSVQCLSCKTVSTVKETFQDLSLPIPNKEYISERRRAVALASLSAHFGTDRSLSESSCTSTSNDLIHLTNEDERLERIRASIQMRRRRSATTGLVKTWQFTVQLVRFALLCITKVFQVAGDKLCRWMRWFFHWMFGPSISLDDCLAAFFSTDELTGNNRYRCDTCKRLRNGIKYANILEAPPILCVHLKRFKHELMYTSKIHNTVSFPLHDLDLSPYIHQKAADAVYDLVAVVCHRGNYNSGHYITYALNRPKNAWFVYDDKIVQPVDESTVARAQAYVLFYRKQEPPFDEDGDPYDDMNENDDEDPHSMTMTAQRNCRDLKDESGSSDASDVATEDNRSGSLFARLLRGSLRANADPLEQLRLRRRYARPDSKRSSGVSVVPDQDILDDIQL